jgi:hypothetical protein
MKLQNREAYFFGAPHSVCSFSPRNVIASSRMNRRIIKALNALGFAGLMA